MQAAYRVQPSGACTPCSSGTYSAATASSCTPWQTCAPGEGKTVAGEKATGEKAQAKAFRFASNMSKLKSITATIGKDAHTKANPGMSLAKTIMAAAAEVKKQTGMNIDTSTAQQLVTRPRLTADDPDGNRSKHYTFKQLQKMQF